MAQIGDVLVKLVGDFAEFSSGMTEASKKLEEFGGVAQEINKRLAGFETLLKGLGVIALAHQLSAYNDKVHESAVKTADLAAKLKLTTDQVQALQYISQRSGVTIEDLAKQYKGNTAELDKMVERLREAGLVMDKDFIERAKKAADQAEDTAKKIQTLWAAIIGPVEKGAQSVLAQMLASVGQSLAIIRANGPDAITVIRSVANILTLGIAGWAAGSGSQIEDLDRRIRDLGDTWSETDRQIRAIEAKPQPLEFAGERAHLENLRKRREELAEQIRANSAIAAQLRNPPTVAPITVTATATGGGTTATKTEDPVEEAIKRYQALGKYAKETAAFVATAGDMTIEALQRELDVRQKIDEILSKRGVNATDDQKRRLEDVVRTSQTWIGEQARLLRAQQQGAATVEKYGDGTKALAKIQDDLNDQLKVGRINQTEYSRALKAGTEATEQAALAARRYDDNIGSFTAGLEHSLNAYSRQNDLFNLGEQSFNALTTAMGEGLDVLAGKSDKTFGQIAADFAQMLARMALQAAVSQVFRIVFGSFSAAPATGAGGGFTTGGQGFGAAGSPFFGGPRAEGGAVVPGKYYTVGEAGPELFVPQAAGTIVPATGSRGGGGDTVVVNLDMKKAEGAQNPSAALEFGRRVKMAVQEVIEQEKRPGGTLYRRVTA
jgi:hypothetical protein